MRTSSPDLLPVFRSDLQARMLAALLSTPGEVSAADLQNRLGGSRSGINQELRRLCNAGILERRAVGRSALYRVAGDSPLVPPLRTLVERTLGVEPELRRRLTDLEGVEAAAIYGSWATGVVKPGSDVDVLVIGSPDRDELERTIRTVEERAGRDVNLSVYDREDWSRRAGRGSGFAQTVLQRPMIELIGSVSP